MLKSIYVWSDFFIKKISFFNKNKHEQQSVVVKKTKTHIKTQVKINTVLPCKMTEEDRLKAVSDFRTSTTDDIVRSFIKEYSDNMALVKEIKFMMGYVFDVIEDDFYFGGALRKKITKIDDYIFSQHRRNLKLKVNIDKLRTIAESKRFSNNPRDNLIAYFVFIEEMDFEIMSLLENFYIVLESGIKDLTLKVNCSDNIKGDQSGLSKTELAEQSFLITDEITRS